MPTGVYPRTAEHKEKIRILAIERLRNPDERAKISNALKGKHYKPMSATGRRNISLAHTRIVIPRDELEYKYCVLGLSTVDIANEYGCRSTTIWRKLIDYGIPVRSVAESLRMPLQRQRTITANLGSKRTSEQRRRFSVIQKERFREPEEREKIRSIVLEYWMNPENRARRSGENAWNWCGGIAFEPYTPDFNDILKGYIRARDGYTCQICGRQENGRKFPCHHINYNKKESYAGNLILLCDRCNGKVNFKRDYWKKILAAMVLVSENGAPI